MNVPNIKNRIGARRVELALLCLVLVTSAACRGGATAEGAGMTLEASGIIQAEEVAVATEFGGLVTEIPVSQAELVSAGQSLLQLDTAILDAQIESAEARITMAEAGLAQMRAGVRPGQLAVAEAQLSQAQAGVLAAQQAVTDTQMLLANPQDIDLQIAIMQGQLDSAGYQVSQAVAIKDMTSIIKRYAGELADTIDKLKPEIPEPIWEFPLPDDIPNPFEFDIGLSDALDMAYIPWWEAWVGVNAATIQQEGLEAQLADLYARRANPQELRAQADTAQSALTQVEAQAALAQAQVDGMRAGATSEQLAVLEAQIAQAQSAVDALQAQRAMLSLTAPLTGTVVNILIHPGEVAARGMTLLTIADLHEVLLTVYVPEDRLGQVSVDQKVRVTVDSFPGRVFEGRVSHIAGQAEFTPRNVATKEERVNLVFAVEIRIPNDDGALKPGMPADVVFD
ncbi:MAG: efflux RND transporter periplasmic adaptor subunit [Anaerolineae bacterium]|nr:efflux RND transporter periplasmic adaptor subunit [Anaerolineae bacterium]